MMIRVCFSFCVVVLLAVMVQPVYAAREFADIYTDCGLGALIAPRNDVVAAITNVTWDLGTTAISSNITSPDTCAGGKEKMASFIYDTQDYLLTDLASGSGVYLDALVDLAAIDQGQHQAFIGKLRDQVGQQAVSYDFGKKSRFERAQTLYGIVVSVVEDAS